MPFDRIAIVSTAQPHRAAWQRQRCDGHCVCIPSRMSATVASQSPACPLSPVTVFDDVLQRRGLIQSLCPSHHCPPPPSPERPKRPTDWQHTRKACPGSLKRSLSVRDAESASRPALSHPSSSLSTFSSTSALSKMFWQMMLPVSCMAVSAHRPFMTLLTTPKIFVRISNSDQLVLQENKDQPLPSSSKVST